MNRPADARHDEQHHHAQGVQLEAKIHVQAADGQPFDRGFRHRRMPAVGVDEKERHHKARDNRENGNEAADGLAAQGKEGDYHCGEQRQEQNQPG